MKIVQTQGEILLAAADSELVGKELREGKLHLKVARDFYGDVEVSIDTFLSSLGICTIANLVGKKVVGLAIESDFVDEENVLYIHGIPYAQYAKIIE